MTQLSNSNINAVADLKPGYTLGAADVALLKEMARRLLAAEAQKPVAWHVAVPDGKPSFGAMMRALDAFYADEDVPENAMLAAFKILIADMRDQTAQPVAVPDLRPDWMINEFSAGWNSCRAVMLNAEPVSKPYKLPQWIPCSERMPEENNIDIWLFDGKYVRHGYIYDGHKFIDWGEGYVELMDVTHWMPMTVPTAPQEPTK